ncbi:hypothetical protein AKJ60_01180 [candidate division MSBL1 archaeon SCGC-AAA385M11]|nr:hypothetical protein AKJ60_01180 [candidate division MSBL1 archaeon SCGC-AAA385M11]
MTKTDLIEAVAKDSGQTKASAERTFDSVLKVLSEQIGSGNKNYPDRIRNISGAGEKGQAGAQSPNW